MLQKPANMSNEQFLHYLYNKKKELGLTWGDIADIMNEYENCQKTADAYRHFCSNRFRDISFEEVTKEETPGIDIEKELAIRNEIQRLRDERTQLNALYRNYSREQSLKEIAVECATKISANNPFILKRASINGESDKEGILLLSDWHYGITIDNHWNQYSPEICKTRVEELALQLSTFIDTYKLEKLFVLNLGDLISGRIHSQVRIENREDAVSQTMHVAELMAQFLFNLSLKVNIEYYDCLDNHSRIEPNMKESIRLESLARIITWYLEERFRNYPAIKVSFNKYSDDIIAFTSKFGWNVVGVHGDLDTQKAVIKNMRGMLIERPDLVCTAHMHHFSANEENECMMISNPSLMGTDGFAESKRLTSKPAQTLIIADEDSPTYAIHRIVVR